MKGDVMKKIIFFALFSLIILLACKSSEEKAKDEYKSLTKSADSASYVAKYDVTITTNNGMKASTELITARREKTSKTITSINAGGHTLSQTTIVSPEGMTVCGKNETMTDFECYSSTMQDKSDFTERARKLNEVIIDKLKITKKESRTLAGQEGSCFIITGVGGEPSEHCYSKDGVIVYNKQKDKRGIETEMQLKEFSKDIINVDLGVPGKIVSKIEMK